MLLEPSNEWYWDYDFASQRLIIQLTNDLALSCHLDKRNMNHRCKKRIHFCADDSSHYFYFLEASKTLSLSIPEQVQLALNAITNMHFHKIRMPQSWYFKYTYSTEAFCIGDIISLSTPDDSGQFIVLEADDKVSTCMLIQDTLQLSESKSLKRFSVIRVMNDRMTLQHKLNTDETENILSFYQTTA